MSLKMDLLLKEKKDDSFLIKVSRGNHDLIKRAAKLKGVSKSEFILEYVLQQAKNVLEIEDYQFLEERNGQLYFKGRNLKVFDNYYMMNEQKIDKQTWADWYQISIKAIQEAKLACTHHRKDEYIARISMIEKENEDLENLEPC